jgi:hypothetical protein
MLLSVAVVNYECTFPPLSCHRAVLGHMLILTSYDTFEVS